jgi:spore germination protein YaaH
MERSSQLEGTMKKLLLCLMFVAATSFAQTKSLFYMTDHPDSVRDFMQRQSKIDIIVPTWYNIDQDGLLYGEPDPGVLRVVKQRHMELFPIVALFNKSGAHTLLTSDKAQTAMIASFISECRQYGYNGFQLDFEDISWMDRDALSAAVKRIADAMHKERLQLQIAVVPNAPGHPGHSAFSKWIFSDWRGVFDLKALSESVDLICLMTYDQHSHWTTPGPVAGWMWTNENLEYALKVVPREKLSLGIALYGYHWYAGDPGINDKEQKPNITADYISADDVKTLRDTYGAHEQWDAEDHSAYFFFYRDQMREWIFYTDKRGFADRYNLAKEQHLQGICAWVLGQEDAAIWDVLPERR